MKLFVFGLGYTAGRFVRRDRARFEAVTGTVRDLDKAADFARDEVDVLRFDTAEADERIGSRLAASDAVLVSVQPGQGGDPVLQRFGDAIANAFPVRTIVYLSTIGVYGDHGGAWIDESAPLAASNPRQAERIRTEQAWLALGARAGKTVVVLRLAGIYGPGRNALADLAAGEARRIDKPDQVFNRIHVDDIGSAIAASFAYRGPETVFNVTDDEPAPAPDVVAYAAHLMGREPPPLIPFATADLSPMARSFYAANRRVRNGAMRTGLGVGLAYPTFRAGLDALWAAREGRS